MKQMTTGAQNDFERATDLARRMVSQWGMSPELGIMVSGESDGEIFIGRSLVQHRQVSEETLRQVDGAIREIIDREHGRAMGILKEHSDKVEVMTRCLLEWETINEDQINDIADGKEPRPPSQDEPSDDTEASGGTGDDGQKKEPAVASSDETPAEA